MSKFSFRFFICVALLFIIPQFAFVASFKDLTTSEKNKLFRFVAKKLPTNNIEILKNSAYPYDLKDIKDDMDASLIHYAVDKKIEKVIPLLQDNGVSIDSQTTAGITPLQIAIFNEQMTMVQFLIEHGADINKKNNNGQTPLIVATSVHNREIIDYLIKNGANLNTQDADGFNVLTRAVEDKESSLIDLYIKLGVDVNARTSFNRTPLHFAVQNSDYETVQKLINAGANINARDYDIQAPNTPLNILYRQKSPISISNADNKIESILLENGAKPAKPYYNNNFSLSAIYLYTSPFDQRALNSNKETPVQVQYTGLNLRYYVSPDLSLSWTYAYGVSVGNSNYGMFMAPGGLLGLQSLFSFLQTDYKSQLHGPAKGLYYALLGLSSILPEGISWDLHMPNAPFMSFSVELDWAKVHYIFPYDSKDPFSIQMTGELQGRLNLLFAEHFLFGLNLNVGFSYTQLNFVWGLGFSLGALF